MQFVKYVHELLLKGTGENCSLVILHVIIMLLLVLLFKLSRLILMLIVMLQDHTRVYTSPNCGVEAVETVLSQKLHPFHYSLCYEMN